MTFQSRTLRHLLFALILAFTLLALAPPVQAAAPCCAITGINARTGLVTAKVNATGQVFTFQVSNARLLNLLRVGQGVYANFAGKQVSVDGVAPCCAIVSLPATLPKITSVTPSVRPSVPADAPQPAQPAPTPAQPAPATAQPASAPSNQSTPGSTKSGAGTKPTVSSSSGSGLNVPKVDTSKMNVPEGTTTGAIRGATAATPQNTAPAVSIPTAITRPIVLPRRLVPKILAQGKQWRLHVFQGTVDGRSLDGEAIYHIVGRAGIIDAPIPQAVKKFLLQDADGSQGNDSVYVLHKRSIELAAQGLLNSNSQASGSVTQGSSNNNGCHDAFGWGNKFTESAGIGFSTPGDLLMVSLTDHDFTVVQGGNVTGGFNVSGNLSLKFPTQAQLSGEIEFRILESACVPIGIKLKHIRVSGTVSMQPYFGLDAQIGVSAEWRKRILTQQLGGFLFFVGPCPMYLGADAYVDADLRVALPDLLEVNYALAGQIQGSFDVQCTMNGCGATTAPGYTQSWSESHQAQFLPHGLRSNVTPALFIGLQAYLNDPDMAEAHIAVKPYLTGDLWAANGVMCGSYQNGGTPSGATALTADIDAGASLVAGLSLPALLPGFVNSALPDDKELYTYQQHLRFYDFTDSTALSPLIQGSTQVEAGKTASFGLQMRSCYPYSDPIDYEIDWTGTAQLGVGAAVAKGPASQVLAGTPAAAARPPLSPAVAQAMFANQSQVTGQPQSSVTTQHIWTTPGTYTIQALPLSDEHHRRFPPRVTTLQVTVVAAPNGKPPEPIKAIGNLTQH